MKWALSGAGAKYTLSNKQKIKYAGRRSTENFGLSNKLFLTLVE
jgi:hypothetical protein